MDVEDSGTWGCGVCAGQGWFLSESNAMVGVGVGGFEQGRPGRGEEAIQPEGMARVGATEGPRDRRADKRKRRRRRRRRRTGSGNMMAGWRNESG